MRLYNTRSGQKEEFLPQNDVVRMYVCGVTPYDSCHLGHAMSYIVFDMIRRFLEFRGYSVKYVQNFTDIDDKIISRANERGVPQRELAEEFIKQYFYDMDALNVRRADIYPRATDEIPKIIEVIEGLIQKGHAYEVEGDVYFSVKSDPDYGKLSRRNPDDMMAGARIDVDEAKEHPLDFALWKSAKPGEPQWQSPWGQGRPGWHIECSAMSLKYLGETLDIHGGGQDLIFPHHENEVAQSESFTGVVPFVRYWLHNGLMQLGEDKMSKSTGKLVTVREALDRYSADAIRLWVLNSHYRSPIVYSDEALEAMERGAERLRRAAHVESEESGKAGVDSRTYRDKFIKAMEDDFNSPQATAVLFDLAREINRGHDEKLDIREAQKVLRELAGVLGLTLAEREERTLPITLVKELRRSSAHKLGKELPIALLNEVRWVTDANVNAEEQIRQIEVCIKGLTDLRDELRQQKKWQQADSIRSYLAELGVILEDTPRGTVWKYKRP